jgi:cytochrome c
MQVFRSVVAAGIVVLAFGRIGPASAQDAAAGEQVFAKCRICHQIGPNAQDLIGPDLDGVVGRKAGTEASYDYSDALKTSGLTWDVPTLTKWLKGPQEFVPGTKMTFIGLSSDKEIANVIAYLSQFKADGSTK